MRSSETSLDTLSIEACHPRYRVDLRHGDVAVHLEIQTTDRATWFAPFGNLYTHIMLLSKYEGTVDFGGRSLPVEIESSRQPPRPAVAAASRVLTCSGASYRAALAKLRAQRDKSGVPDAPAGFSMTTEKP